MSIFVVGDIHGSLDIEKLGARHFDARGLTRKDYVIICGDFGLIFQPEGRDMREEQWWLSWLDGRPWTTLWIDGNHENFDRIEAMEESRWHGGRVQYVTDHIIHLMRGQVFDIDGMSFFTMGGASSTDREWRVEGESWWPQEIPSAEDEAEAVRNLNACGWQVDYVLTHCAPTGLLKKLDAPLSLLEPDEATDMLQRLRAHLSYRAWFFGHYHVDKTDGKHFCLYNRVLSLDELELEEKPRLLMRGIARGCSRTLLPVVGKA